MGESFVGTLKKFFQSSFYPDSGLDVKGRDSRLGFKTSRLISLLSWAFSGQYEKIRIIGIINRFMTFKYKSYLNTLSIELCWLCSFFLYWFFSHCPQSNQLILKKSDSRIFENHGRTFINLTNAFDFLCLFYLAFDEIKWSCAFAKYITQKFIIKARSTSTSFY